MDSITRTDCKLVLNEVYEGDVHETRRRVFRANAQSKRRERLSEHSPLAETDGNNDVEEHASKA